MNYTQQASCIIHNLIPNQKMASYLFSIIFTCFVFVFILENKNQALVMHVVPSFSNTILSPVLAHIEPASSKPIALLTAGNSILELIISLAWTETNYRSHFLLDFKHSNTILRSSKLRRQMHGARPSKAKELFGSYNSLNLFWVTAY